jgi:hypothetical protein
MLLPRLRLTLLLFQAEKASFSVSWTVLPRPTVLVALFFFILAKLWEGSGISMDFLSSYKQDEYQYSILF